MNIAFPAFLLFLLLVPGFIFRAAFRTLEGARLDAGPFTSSSIKSVLCALALNFVAWLLVERYTAYTIHWDALLALLVGDKSTNVDRAIGLIAKQPVPHVMYFLVLYVGSGTFGWALRVLTFGLKLDQRDRLLAPLLRLGNEWFYLFKGYDEEREPDLIYVTTVVNLDEPYLYRGVLKAFYLKGDGDLDRIVITSASRRKLSRDKSELEITNPAFYPIDGDFFMLRYSEMVTVNVFYLFAEVTARSSAPITPLSGTGTAAASGSEGIEGDAS